MVHGSLSCRANSSAISASGPKTAPMTSQKTTFADLRQATYTQSKDATRRGDYQRRTEFHTSLARMRHQNLTAIPSRAKAMTVAWRSVPATPCVPGSAPKWQSR